MSQRKFFNFSSSKSPDIFVLFEDDSRNMVEAAGFLKDFFAAETFEDREKIYENIRNAEHYGDEISKKIYFKLDRSFSLIYDRDDIHDLVSEIDDVIDTINSIGRRVLCYKPKQILPIYREMSGLILSAAEEIDKCIVKLRNIKESTDLVLASCEKIKSIEHEADDFYFASVSELFETEHDARELIMCNKILERLERCVDEEEDVLDSLKTIIAKLG